MDYTNLNYRNATFDQAIGFEVDCQCENFQPVNVVNENGQTTDFTATLQAVLDELELQTTILSSGA